MHTQDRGQGWSGYHRRTAALKTVIDELDRTGDSVPPWTEEAAAAFHDEEALLVALQDKWTRRLLGRVDTASELGTDSENDVADAWRAVAHDLAGVRRVLDAQAGHPALRRHVLHENRMVAVAAGLATLGDPVVWAAARGAALVSELRDVPVPAPRAGFHERLMAALRAIA